MLRPSYESALTLMDFLYLPIYYCILQELLALSTALSATLTAQLAFDSKHLKYCSTYNLAEAVDKDMKKGIYHLGDAYELTVTPRKSCWYNR